MYKRKKTSQHDNPFQCNLALSNNYSKRHVVVVVFMCVQKIVVVLNSILLFIIIQIYQDTGIRPRDPAAR